jgi:hypothetical protein
MSMMVSLKFDDALLLNTMLFDSCENVLQELFLVICSNESHDADALS